MATRLTYYEILGVSKNASADEIKSRYKALVLKFHPDREGSALANEAMVSINRAYEVLSDPKMRHAYDITMETAKEMHQKKDKRPKRMTHAWTVFETWKVPKLILVFFAISCIIGYEFDTFEAVDTAYFSAIVTNANRHYFWAMFHEALLTLPLSVPVLGVAWGVLKGFAMGALDKAVVTTLSGHDAKTSGLVIQYLILATIIKSAAYCLGMYQSMILAYSIKIKKFTYMDKVNAHAHVIIMIILASLAGHIEHAMVNTH